MSETPNYGLYLEDDASARFQVWREKINGTDNSNMVKIDTALGTDQNGNISVAQNATIEQRDAARMAMLSVIGQSEGQLTIAADGEMPDVDIPVVVILLG